jgi:hypothetical protein
MDAKDRFSDGLEACRALLETLDLRGIERREWRAVCRGLEREPMQRFLLELAGLARSATRADRLALYQAAHAVLPLRGPALRELAELLLAARPVPIVWGDALVEALAEEGGHGTALAGELLDGLREMIQRPLPPEEARRAQSYLRHIAALGYYPDWLRPWLDEYAGEADNA